MSFEACSDTGAIRGRIARDGRFSVIATGGSDPSEPALMGRTPLGARGAKACALGRAGCPGYTSGPLAPYSAPQIASVSALINM